MVLDPKGFGEFTEFHGFLDQFWLKESLAKVELLLPHPNYYLIEPKDVHSSELPILSNCMLDGFGGSECGYKLELYLWGLVWARRVIHSRDPLEAAYHFLTSLSSTSSDFSAYTDSSVRPMKARGGSFNSQGMASGDQTSSEGTSKTSKSRKSTFPPLENWLDWISCLMLIHNSNPNSINISCSNFFFCILLFDSASDGCPLLSNSKNEMLFKMYVMIRMAEHTFE